MSASAGSEYRLGRTLIVAAQASVICAALIISFENIGSALSADAKARAAPEGGTRSVETPEDHARQLVPPDAGLALTLIRTTLLTLNDALRSDNFTVLRDVSSIAFRNAHTAGGLSRRFSTLAQQGIDLSAVAVLTPTLSEPPSVDAEKGALRLKGYFDGRPMGIAFDLLFAAEDGRWKVSGLSIQTSPPRVPLASGKN